MNEQTKEIKERTFILKTYTRKELREIYGVPPKTFQRWLEPFNEAWGMKNKRYLTIEQVRKIVEQFGIPGELKAK
ncbi:MAG: hypothetical protein J0L87_07445 [Bacteroidetes bacterium]|nr:hypothetical protein [Bacteroidota bacterium]